jgi:hypothetical protein
VDVVGATGAVTGAVAGVGATGVVVGFVAGFGARMSFIKVSLGVVGVDLLILML